MTAPVRLTREQELRKSWAESTLNECLICEKMTTLACHIRSGCLFTYEDGCEAEVLDRTRVDDSEDLDGGDAVDGLKILSQLAHSPSASSISLTMKLLTTCCSPGRGLC